MKLNSILTPPTLTVPPARGDDEFSTKVLDTIEAILSGEKISENKSIISVSIENQLERMVSNCAYKVWVPSSIPPSWGTIKSLRTNLPPSYQNILGFSDRNESLWKAIENYLKPVFEDIPKDKDNHSLQNLFLHIFWAMYLLTISARQNSEVFINPEKITILIDKLSSNLEMSAESRARIMKVRGIFALYTLKTDVQGFQCITTSGVTFKERLDEIIEDAYLLEASNLRVFFGYESNLAAIKRDIRTLTNLIVKNRKWAKGLIGVANNLITLPVSIPKVTDSINMIIDGALSDKSAPVLLMPKPVETKDCGRMIFESLRNPYENNKNCLTRLSGEYEPIKHPNKSLKNGTRKERRAP